MNKRQTTGLGLRLLAGAGVVMLAGCGDDAPQKAALEFAPVVQAPAAQVAEPAALSTVVPQAAPQPAVVQATAAAPATPTVKAVVKAEVKPEAKPEVKPAQQPASKPQVVATPVTLKPAVSLGVAPAAPKAAGAVAEVAAPVSQPPVAKAATEWPKPVQTQAQVVTQIHFRPAQVVSQETAPMPWLKPFEFNGVNNQSAPSPVRTASYEPRPNPYANAYVPQPTQTVALQAPNFNLSGLMPISYDSTHRLADFLPSIKKVHPTGERPMVVVSFKCPTEGLGIATPSTKILHGVVDTVLGGVNATNALPWSIQQVCS